MLNSPLVYVIVITYDGKKFLSECFSSLKEKTTYENFKLLLLDNGSSDGSSEYVAEHFPDVEILRVFPNAGYAHAANKAVEYAREHNAQYVVLSNDDIVIRDSRWLTSAIELSEKDPTVGIVGFSESTSSKAIEPPEEVKDTTVEYFSGFSMVMPIKLFDAIGNFDETYFVVGDEDDLGARAQRAGFRVAKLNIPIFHYGGGTNTRYSLRTAYLQMRNGLRFCLKNRNPLHAMLRAIRMIDIACNPWPLTFDINDGAHRRIRNSGNVFVNAGLYCKALAWNIWSLPQTFLTRHREQQLIRASLNARNQNKT